MEQALETLEWCEPDYDENPTGFKKWAAVMPILRETLVVPEQRPWQGLTDGELSEIYNRINWDINNSWDYERAIETKLKEKQNEW